MASTNFTISDEGYIVIPQVLTRQQAAELAASIREDIFTYTFKRQGINLDAHDDNNLKYLTDKMMRALLGPLSKDTVQVNGNSRKPRWSKSTGMIHDHFNELVMRLIHFNPQLYDIARQLYGKNNLAFTQGPERVSMKVQGCTDMPQHIDMNPWYPHVNFPERLQSLVCLSIDEKIAARDSGTICLYVNYHHYWHFAAALFHPENGLHPVEDNNKRFYLLPRCWKSKYQKLLEKHIVAYTAYLYQLTVPNDLTTAAFYARAQQAGIVVPAQVKMPYWKPIPMSPGDMIFWRQDLPHQSLRNKSKIVRTVAYYSLLPVEAEWYNSEGRRWVLHQYSTGQAHYALNNNEYSYQITNLEEYEQLQRDPARLARIIELTQANDLNKLLTGQASYY